MIDDSLSDVQQEKQMSVKELILKTEGDSTKAKFDSSNEKIYLTLFRLDKPAAGMIIDRSQAHLLMLYLQEHLKSGDVLKPLEQRGYWYCKACRTLHARDFICERLANEQS